jgi:hypothetical protein
MKNHCSARLAAFSSRKDKSSRVQLQCFNAQPPLQRYILPPQARVRQSAAALAEQGIRSRLPLRLCGGSFSARTPR